MHRIAQLLFVLACCLPAIALAQPRKEPAKGNKVTAAAPAPAPVSATPERTTASFGDWVLRCEDVTTQAKRVCEVAHVITRQGQTGPIAQVAIGRRSTNDGEQLIVVLPPNIAITAKPHVVTAKPGAAPIELAWQRCLPGGCFALAPMTNTVVGDLGAQTEPGRIVFKNAAEQDVTIPLSFRGLSQAMAALAKAQ